MEKTNKPAAEKTCQYQQDPDQHYDCREDYGFLVPLLVHIPSINENIPHNYSPAPKWRSI